MKDQPSTPGRSSMPYLVTLAASNVSLPNGQLGQFGQVALLSDDQFITLSPTAVSSIFSNVDAIATTAGDGPATTVGPQDPTINGSLINGVWTLDNTQVGNAMGAWPLRLT